MEAKAGITELSEYARRGAIEMTLLVEDIADILREFDCPEEILKPLEEWINKPVPTASMLKKWTAAQELPK